MTLPDHNSGLPDAIRVSEVKYSLPELLEEIKLERAAGSFAMEKLDHHEIEKLFKANPRKKRRAKPQE